MICTRTLMGSLLSPDERNGTLIVFVFPKPLVETRLSPHCAHQLSSVARGIKFCCHECTR